MNAFSERGDYYTARYVFDYLLTENTYLPWRTVLIHLNDFVSIMEYRKTFYQVAVRKLKQHIYVFKDTQVADLIKNYNLDNCKGILQFYVAWH